MIKLWIELILERAKLGAIMSRMTKAIDNISNVAMNTKESRGRITDADFALESANLLKIKYYNNQQQQ